MSWIPAVVAVLALVVIGLKLRSALRLAGDPSLEGWAEFAKEYDLSFDGGDLVRPARVAGNWKGRAVEIERGPAPVGLLHIKAVTDTHLATGLYVRREDGAAALGKFAGFQDIQLGDEALDGLLRIQGIGDAHIIALLTDGKVSRRLGQLFSRYPGALIERDAVSLVRKRTTRPPEDLIALLDAVTNAADALDEANRELSGSTLGLVDTAEERTDPRPTPPPLPRTEEIIPPLLTDEPPTPIPVPPEEPGFDDEADTAPLPDLSSPLVEIIETLADRSLNDAARENILAAVGVMAFPMEVDGISRSSGNLPEALKRGRTVQGHPPGHPLKKLVVRFPPSRNPEIEALRFGHRASVNARPVHWDDFTRRLTLDAGEVG